MKLDDFEQKFSVNVDADLQERVEELKEIKSYITSKLWEFGERLKMQELPEKSPEWAAYNIAVRDFNEGIDKELSELE